MIWDIFSQAYLTPILYIFFFEVSIKILFLARIVMTNIDSILKSRDNTLLTKIRLVKAMVFLIVMYGCVSLDYSPLDFKEIQPVHPKGDQS